MLFDFSREKLIAMLLSLPAILFCLTIHELAHAFVANKLGDHTARNLGRLTLNPAKHIDPIGFIALLLAGFGWAKPVPVIPRNFKNPKVGMALTAVAGPVSNLLTAFVFAFIYCFTVKMMDGIIIGDFVYFLEEIDPMLKYLLDILWCFVIINISLAIFNLIPIVPLDGSRVLDLFLPTKLYLAYHRYERYIHLALLLILFSNFLDPVLSKATGFVENIIMYLPEKVFF